MSIEMTEKPVDVTVLLGLIEDIDDACDHEDRPDENMPITKAALLMVKALAAERDVLREYFRKKSEFHLTLIEMHDEQKDRAEKAEAELKRLKATK